MNSFEDLENSLKALMQSMDDSFELKAKGGLLDQIDRRTADARTIHEYLEKLEKCCKATSAGIERLQKALDADDDDVEAQVQTQSMMESAGADPFVEMMYGFNINDNYSSNNVSGGPHL